MGSESLGKGVYANIAIIGLGDCGGYGGVWVPRVTLEKLLREVLNYLEVLWLLTLEFAHYDYKEQSSISAKDFALSIVAAADISHLRQLLKQVDTINIEPCLSDVRITLEEFKQFAELRDKLEPFSFALFDYKKVKGYLTRGDFQRATSQVCSVSISENVVEIIFHIFDSKKDGTLSADEFVRVLQNRHRDIAQHVKPGLNRLPPSKRFEKTEKKLLINLWG
ncbi:hypothetical protein ACFE04_027196 [Oxalis oulophora]